jgi:predicted ArsR family transcriptional regulator
MGRSREFILAALADHKPKSLREIAKATGLTNSAANNFLHLCWKAGLILRTKEPIYEFERRFKGRAGISQTTRPYHLYLLRLEGTDSMLVDGRKFVKYAKKYLDVRGGGKVSKVRSGHAGREAGEARCGGRVCS